MSHKSAAGRRKSGDHIFLVRAERKALCHAGNLNVAAIVFSRSYSIETVIVYLLDGFDSRGVCENPFMECLLDFCQLITGENGFLAVEHILFTLHAVRITVGNFILDFGFALIENKFGKLVCVQPFCTEFFVDLYTALRGFVRNAPFVCGGDIFTADHRAWQSRITRPHTRFKSVVHELSEHLRGNEERPKTETYICNAQLRRLVFLECLDISAETLWIFFSFDYRKSELVAGPAREVFLGSYPAAVFIAAVSCGVTVNLVAELINYLVLGLAA